MPPEAEFYSSERVARAVQHRVENMAVFVFQVKFPGDRRKFTYWHNTRPQLGATVEVPPTPGKRNTRAQVVELSGGKWSAPIKRIVRVVPEAEPFRERCCSCCCCQRRCEGAHFGRDC